MAATPEDGSSVTARVSEATSTVKDKTSDAMSSASETVKEKTGQAVEKARSKAQEAREKVGGRVRDEVDRRSTEAGEQVGALAEALRKTADDLEQDGKDAPARLARQAAERLQGVGGYLSFSDAERIKSDLESFARRQPWLVTAAGALLGIAAARILKASQPTQANGATASSAPTPAPMPPVTEPTTIPDPTPSTAPLPTRPTGV